MYRYYIFMYENYYPSGGTNDLKIKANRVMDARSGIDKLEYGVNSNIEILDNKTWERYCFSVGHISCENERKRVAFNNIKEYIEEGNK